MIVLEGSRNEMPSGVSVLSSFLKEKDYLDAVIKLIVMLTLHVYSKIAIILGRYVYTPITPKASGLHNNTEHLLH